VPAAAAILTAVLKKKLTDLPEAGAVCLAVAAKEAGAEVAEAVITGLDLLAVR